MLEVDSGVDVEDADVIAGCRFISLIDLSRND
jgi:hypothetical protein